MQSGGLHSAIFRRGGRLSRTADGVASSTTYDLSHDASTACGGRSGAGPPSCRGSRGRGAPWRQTVSVACPLPAEKRGEWPTDAVWRFPRYQGSRVVTLAGAGRSRNRQVPHSQVRVRPEAARSTGERGPRKVPPCFCKAKNRAPWTKVGYFLGNRVWGGPPQREPWLNHISY